MGKKNILGSIADSFTFDLFDFNGSQDMPDFQSIPPYEPTEAEFDILNLLKSDFGAMGSQDYQTLQSKSDSYRDLMMSDNVLSPEELSDFDQQYELELSALTDKYDTQFERHGAGRMADLVGRGVLETTTGRDIIAEDQGDYADAYSGATADLMNQKESSIQEAEAYKREMAMKGYQLTSGILQQKRTNALQSLNMLQDYNTGEKVSNIGRELSNQMRQQSWDQYAYNNKMSGISSTTGLLFGMFGG